MTKEINEDDLRKYRQLGREYWTEPYSRPERQDIWNQLIEIVRTLRNEGAPKTMLMEYRGELSRSEVTKLLDTIEYPDGKPVKFAPDLHEAGLKYLRHLDHLGTTAKRKTDAMVIGQQYIGARDMYALLTNQEPDDVDQQIR